MAPQKCESYLRSKYSCQKIYGALNTLDICLWPQWVLLSIYVSSSKWQTTRLWKKKGFQTFFSFYRVVTTPPKAPYRVLECVGILFYLFVFNGLFFDLVGKVGHRESGVNAATVLFETVINKLVLILKSTLETKEMMMFCVSALDINRLLKEWAR